MVSAGDAVRTATQGDNQALLELIFHAPQEGRVLLGQDRSPDFFARVAPYDEGRVLVAEDALGLAGTVSCGLKSVLVQGEVQRAGYIFDLAVAERARGLGWARRLLAEAEAWARESGADLLYAHVMEGNRAGLSAFAAAGYRSVVLMRSQVFPVPARGRAAAAGVRLVEAEDWPAVGRLIAREFQGHDLLRAETAESLPALWRRLPGYREELVWVHGRPPVAVLGLWDYSPVARAVPLRMPPAQTGARRAEPQAVDAVPPDGGPSGPVPGRPMSYGMLLGVAGARDALRALFRRALTQARAVGLDTIVFFHDPRTSITWARSSSLGGAYHLVAKALRPGPAHSLGERPVWVDPVA